MGRRASTARVRRRAPSRARAGKLQWHCHARAGRSGGGREGRKPSRRRRRRHASGVHASRRVPAAVTCVRRSSPMERGGGSLGLEFRVHAVKTNLDPPLPGNYRCFLDKKSPSMKSEWCAPSHATSHQLTKECEDTGPARPRQYRGALCLQHCWHVLFQMCFALKSKTELVLQTQSF